MDIYVGICIIWSNRLTLDWISNYVLSRDGSLILRNDIDYKLPDVVDFMKSLWYVVDAHIELGIELCNLTLFSVV